MKAEFSARLNELRLQVTENITSVYDLIAQINGFANQSATIEIKNALDNLSANIEDVSQLSASIDQQLKSGETKVVVDQFMTL